MAPLPGRSRAPTPGGLLKNPHHPRQDKAVRLHLAHASFVASCAALWGVIHMWLAVTQAFPVQGAYAAIVP
jgi:hypothetical protein